MHRCHDLSGRWTMMRTLELSAMIAPVNGKLGRVNLRRGRSGRVVAMVLASAGLNACLVSAPCGGEETCGNETQGTSDAGDAASVTMPGSDAGTYGPSPTSASGETEAEESTSLSGADATSDDAGTDVFGVPDSAAPSSGGSLSGPNEETTESAYDSSETGTRDTSTSSSDRGNSEPASAEVSSNGGDTSSVPPQGTSAPLDTSGVDNTEDQGPPVHETKWQESFEEGLAGWVVEGSSWGRGSPSNGAAPTPHSGGDMIGTGLTGPYSREAGRVNSPSFLVPGSTREPYLRYWYWYALESGDTVQVQVRVGDNGSWQDVELLTDTISTVAGQGGRWMQGILPLTEFAGQEIRVGFALSASGATGSMPGFFLDDVSLETGPMDICSCQGFNNGNSGDWSVEGGQWGIGVPSGAGAPDPVGDGDGAAGTNLSGNYASLAAAPEARLASPTVKVADDGNTKAKFNYWYSFANQGSGKIQLRVVGESWQDLPGYTFTGQHETWEYVEIPLADWAGQLVQIGFLVQNGGGLDAPTTRGFYVDEFNF